MFAIKAWNRYTKSWYIFQKFRNEEDACAVAMDLKIEAKLAHDTQAKYEVVEV